MKHGLRRHRNTRKMAVGLGLGLSLLATVSHACELTIIWRAALTGRASAPSRAAGPAATRPAATGTAAIDFDAADPGATVRVETTGLRDVQTIALHVARSYTDHTGPAVLTLYSAGDGPLPATLTKHVTEADLHAQTSPHVAAFADVVSAVLNGRAYVVVATKAHPEGELSGVIRMHKEQVYSDDPADAAHDAALHHAAQARRAAPSPTP